MRAVCPWRLLIRFARRRAVIPIVLSMAAMAACGGSSSQPVARPNPPPYVYPPPRYAPPLPPPAFDPFQAIMTLGLSINPTVVRQYLAALPCPMPGLPPDLARLVDCRLLREVIGAIPYVPRPILPGMLPGVVDHRAMGLVGMVRDQGQVGSCAANAIAAMLDTAARRAGRTDIFGSSLHLYVTYRDPANRRGMAAVTGVATTAEAVWPYLPAKACAFTEPHDADGCDRYYGVASGAGYTYWPLIAERQRANAIPVFQIGAFESLVSDDRRIDFDQVAALLASGEPLYFGSMFPYNWSSSDLRTSVAPPPYGVMGPHATVLRGYRAGPMGREFLLQNSWGFDWGEGGFLWVPERYVGQIAQRIYRMPSRLVMR
jgi:hypothetical protein